MQNIALPANVMEPAVGMEQTQPPAVIVQPETAPAKVLTPDQVRSIGAELQKQFIKYKNDRRMQELKWLRNQRQYLGIYDLDIEGTLSTMRSRAYPKLTRIKTIATVSRIMNLMFPGNDRNWDLSASPSAEMQPEDVQDAIQEYMQKLAESGTIDPNYQLKQEDVQCAVQELANKRAKQLRDIIDDQLQELGGDQTYDYIALNRQMVKSGVLYGLGILEGPYPIVHTATEWSTDELGQAAPEKVEIYKPYFMWRPVWDFYPDFSAKTLDSMDGYFTREVMSRGQFRDLADREDFFGNVIKSYLKDHSQGNYKPMLHEQELKVMGVKAVTNEQSPDGNKYEVLTWKGRYPASKLKDIGVEVPEGQEGDDVEAEIWMIEDYVIKADINPWRKMGLSVKTLHYFLFDEDDTSPIGNGLPNVIRDSQMSLCAATRMLLDNASVVCGPNVEVNEKLLAADQDKTSIHAYKVWRRIDDDPMTVQFPAIREIRIDSHLQELEAIIRLFLEFADAETFVGPLGIGDSGRMPSEPMRTAAGASMLRGDASLPFKDVIRNFDKTTQSIIYSLVQYNKVYRPGEHNEGDFNVVARGATSLISKEVRGQQMDQLAQTLTDEEKMEIDNRELLKERLATRDAERLLLSESEASIRRKQREQSMQEQQDMMRKQAEATVREMLSASFKNITQGQKNQAATAGENVATVLALLEQALNEGSSEKTGASGQSSSEGG